MGRLMWAPALLALLVQGCGDKEVVIPEPDSRPVKLVAVSVGDNETFRTFPAVVEAGDKAVLAFRVSGQLDKVHSNPGDIVKRGQVLAHLNTDELSLLLEQAKADYELAYVQYKRDKELLKTNVVSELDFDRSEAELNQAKADLDKAQANLSYASLVAPYDGTLSLSLVENYEYIAAKQPVMHIQSAGVINVTFQLPDQLLARFQHQENVERDPTVTFDTIPGQTFSAEFKEIDTEADEKTSSYKVTLFMERPEGFNLLPGMAGHVRVAIPHVSSGSLPSRAILTEGDTTFVWRVDEQGIVSKVPVQLDERRRVLNGLNDGDLIATSGVNELQEGQKVRKWVKERGL
ncbi:efflux RND transporter periplasmic adaptor subunit [Photobacterium rosenbergii]|uniref:Efflux RND transporter periplasmic adaptor subunit n=1 Tax=Photobacterium rosenbergii TaxID=294936 RepID=A0A2T3NGT4_9GAMM|nr:efflux RND transporter periplasmic adaptor subunit [Photobacterium rosenbergii]MBY5943838.1 efflux RND transporter periplasmic adaptor subunit [Photobacterium rosenbergii]PSW14224.1 efflux RND transporter periplasmic adaptor subunit [Photobacterium rosenbergii]